MLITGIRRKVGAEIDERRSGLFTRYLIHYSQMFAYMGIIISVFIVIDYLLLPQPYEETITNRYYQITDNISRTEYHLFTESCRFLADAVFYENINIEDKVTIYRTPIFNSIINVSHRTKQNVYICNPDNIYGWPLIIIGITFICSLIIFLKTLGWMKKRIHVKYDSVVNLGIINSILCIITLIIVLFHIPY